MLLCCSRESINHRKLTRYSITRTYLQILNWCVRHIIFCISSWFIICISIDSKHRKVSSMSRPNPVISVSTKFSNTVRRCPNKTNILEGFFHHHVIFVSVIEWLYVCSEMRIRCSFRNYSSNVHLDRLL